MAFDDHVSVKDGAQDWTVKEQIIEDPVTGLTIQFERIPGVDATFRLRIFGDILEFGNRELIFDVEGKMVAAGTHTTGGCKPTWLTEIE